MKLFAVSDSLRIFAVMKCPFGQLSLYLIGNPKAENTVCKDSQGEGVYGRYHSVLSNLASLKLSTEVMQR